MLAFEREVAISRLVLVPPLGEEMYHGSYRIRRFRLSFGSAGDSTEWEMPDKPAAFVIELDGTEATSVTLEVISTYPPEQGAGRLATEGLAIAEIEILGAAD